VVRWLGSMSLRSAVGIFRLNDRPQNGKGPPHSELLQLLTPEFWLRRSLALPGELLSRTAGQELFEPFASRIFEDFGRRPFLFDSSLM
jgi:hypothetical protein